MSAWRNPFRVLIDLVKSSPSWRRADRRPGAEILRMLRWKARPGRSLLFSHAVRGGGTCDTRAGRDFGARGRDATALARILATTPMSTMPGPRSWFGSTVARSGNPRAPSSKRKPRFRPPHAVGPGCHNRTRCAAGRARRHRCELHDRRRCSIGRTAAGSSVTVYPLRHRQARLIHAGVVIGADGFGMAPDSGRWIRFRRPDAP